MGTVIHEILFSPTGGTAGVVRALTQGFEGERRMVERRVVDLMTPAFSSEAIAFEQTDLCIIAAPVFGGRIPPLAAERIKALRGNGARAVLVCVYGNRAYEDALLELQDVARAAGFRPFAAVTAVAAHSIMKQYAVGRPDARDKERLGSFGRQLWEAFLRPDAEQDLSGLPGRRPYKEYRVAPMPPLTSADCLGCRVCVDACPAGAIMPGTPRQIDASRCMSCMHCIAVCPQQAGYLDEEKVRALAERLAAQFAERKECELFLGK